MCACSSSGVEHACRGSQGCRSSASHKAEQSRHRRGIGRGLASQLLSTPCHGHGAGSGCLKAFGPALGSVGCARVVNAAQALNAICDNVDDIESVLRTELGTRAAVGEAQGEEGVGSTGDGAGVAPHCEAGGKPQHGALDRGVMATKLSRVRGKEVRCARRRGSPSDGGDAVWHVAMQAAEGAVADASAVRSARARES